MTDHDRLELLLGAIAGDNAVPSDLRTRLEEALAQIAGFSGGRSTSTASTKKIYFHPITVSFTSASIKIKLNNHDSVGRITFIILNNDSTPFTRETLVSFINGLYSQVGETVRMITGGVLYNTTDGLQDIIFIGCSAVDTFSAYCVSSTGAIQAFDIDLAEMSTTYFYDGVNAIN